ncbi:MAG: LCP family protein [Treponema sp.]|jgi:anionic cell wall polymer biosynthesis LytR-Cps2A-Psr (LCP) family protein|nr:LCP family protein [Treponema sp.]
MRRAKTDASIFILLIIILILAAGAFFTVYTIRSDPVEEALTENRVINTLFVIEQDGKPLSSFVLMFYPATKRAAVFDIPGNLGLILRHIDRVDRIDTAYNQHNIGIFREEIERLLGVEVGYSLVITTENLGRAVDLVEGVEILIPSPVEIYGDAPVLFPSGKITLDGDKARIYVTYELPDEDREMAVIRRQRFFLGFLKRLGEMNEYLKNPEAAHLFRTCFTTSMSQRTKVRLFDEFAGIDTDRTGVQAVGGNFREALGLVLPYYNGSLIKEIVRQSLGTLTRRVEGSMSERVFTVEVLNGTAENGLAGRTAELLRGFGYDVISVGNADRTDYELTEIIDRSGFEDMVNAFGEVIRCANIRYESPVPDEESPEDLTMQNLEYRSDFTLIIGRDFNGRYVTGR